MIKESNNIACFFFKEKMPQNINPSLDVSPSLSQTAMIFDAELDTLKLPTLISSRMTMPLSV
jgi:hypothetical protein